MRCIFADYKGRGIAWTHTWSDKRSRLAAYGHIHTLSSSLILSIQLPLKCARNELTFTSFAAPFFCDFIFILNQSLSSKIPLTNRSLKPNKILTPRPPPMQQIIPIGVLNIPVITPSRVARRRPRESAGYRFVHRLQLGLHPRSFQRIFKGRFDCVAVFLVDTRLVLWIGLG